MRWLVVFAVALIATCSGVTENNAVSASTDDSASATGSGSASGGVTADTGGSPSTAKTTETMTSESTANPDATASASASASVDIGTPTTTPDIGISTSALPPFNTPSVAPSPSPSPSPTPTTAKPTPPTDCDICNNPDFMGFGFKPGKCGCCPWPCCCKCVQTQGDEIVECRALLDLAFIMDDSGSISGSDWTVAKQFFSDVVSIFSSIGTDQHVASVTFSTNATLNWNLADPQTSSLEALQESISKLDRTAGFTNTAEAMERATKEVFVAGQDNPNAANVAVVMTDGRANFRRNEIASLAADLRAKAETICIGVTTEIDMDELKTICDEDKIFSVNDFASLQTILKALQTQVCPTPPKTEKCFCCCTPEQFWGAGGAHYYRW